MLAAHFEAPIAETPVVVLDTETTGLCAWQGDRVVEIAAIRLEDGQVVEAFDQLVNPGRHMPAEASAVCGITDAHLADAPPFGAVADPLLALLDGALIVAHNARFDATFLALELLVDGRLPEPPTAPLLPNPWLCTLQLARRHFHFGRNSLSAIARRLGVRSGRKHRALSDVYTTTAIFKQMVRELEQRRLRDVPDLLHAQGGPIYTPAPPRPALPAPIGEALAGRQRLRILYVGPGGESEREITPLYATADKGRSYVVAHCHWRNAQRTFRLDRIFSAELVKRG